MAGQATGGAGTQLVPTYRDDTQRLSARGNFPAPQDSEPMEHTATAGLDTPTGRLPTLGSKFHLMKLNFIKRLGTGMLVFYLYP